MDIGKWLETTADRDAPDPNKDCFVPNHLALRSETQLPSLQKYHAKRKRSLSNSSQLIARSFRGPEGYNVSRKQVPKPDSRTRSCPSSSVAYFPQDIVTRRPYEKCARHKTRPELYDAEATRRQRVSKQQSHATSKPRRLKSYRRARDGTRTAGLVQEFHLKTGPKDKRLTLKPKQPTVGLFKHGRASTQVTGRGTGLPDLVFNEMKFLQKPKSHSAKIEHGLDHDRPEPDWIVSSPPKGGISRHWKPIEPRADPKGVRSNGVQAHARLNDMPHHRGNPSADQDSARPRRLSLDGCLDLLPGEQYPELVVQTTAKELEACPSPDNTVYTWSISDALPQLSQFQLLPRTSVPRHESHEPRPQHDPQNDSCGPELRSSLGMDPPSRSQRERSRLTTRDNLSHTDLRHTSSLPKTRQAPHTPAIGHSKHTTTSKCLSLTRTHSPTGISTVSRRISRDNDSLRGDYRTSDILDIRRRSPDSPEAVLAETSRVLLASQGQKDPGLDTSTPIARLLRQAHEATTFQYSPMKQYASNDRVVGTECTNVRLSPVPQAWSPHGSIMKQVDYQAHSRGTAQFHSRGSSLGTVRTKLMPQFQDLPYDARGRQSTLTSTYPVTTVRGCPDQTMVTNLHNSASPKYRAELDLEANHTAYRPHEVDLVPAMDVMRSTHLRSQSFLAQDPIYKEPNYDLPCAEIECPDADEYEDIDLTQHEQNRRGFLCPPSKRLNTGVRHSTQDDDDLANFWRPQRL